MNELCQLISIDNVCVYIVQIKNVSKTEELSQLMSTC